MKRAGRKTDTVFVLIIFCVFAVSVLMVLMLGASIYKNMTDLTRDGQDESTTLAFVWTKVKNCDEAGSIYIDDFYGRSALCFDEVLGGTVYQTLIYHFNGWVYELFCEKGLGLRPEDGIQIIRIGELEFKELDYGLIKIVTGDKSLLVSPRGGNARIESGMIIVD